MAQTLFSVIISVMLTDSFQDCDATFFIRYRIDGKLFNLGKLQANSKVQTEVLNKPLYADVIEENANTEQSHIMTSMTSQSAKKD